MATVRRIGFGTIFELEDSKVGIGTDVATHTLQALGNIRSEAATDIGISSLSTYQGFTDKEARFTGGQIDNQSQSGATSGEIVIDGDVTVSSATTFTSGPQNLTVTDTFTLPSGDTNSRELKPTAGSFRFNQDFATLEFYTGNNWATVNTFTEMQNSPSNRGRAVFGGGWTGDNVALSQISYVNIMSLGNALEWGNITGNARSGAAPASSSTRGLFMGGGSPTRRNEIDYLTIASRGSTQDFGNLTESIGFMGGVSSSTRGLRMGGTTPSKVNTIDYVEMATLGDALDFGDLTEAPSACGGLSSPTRGFRIGGSTPTFTSTIDFFTIASKGNAVKFGDMTTQKDNCRGNVQSTTRGIIAGGRPTPGTGFSFVEFITMASEGNSTMFGDLTRAHSGPAGASNQVRGIFYGGGNSTPYTNVIDFITIATTGDAQDFGDATQTTNNAAGLSDSHGGLGGF